MPVSGQELASLDFANLIGGPLNALVEAQAKSAISTANFIKEVGFDSKGKVVNVDFTYNRKNEDGSDQEFTLTVPFITMLPIPYISINYAEIEFNAKITSTTETKSDSNFDHVTHAGAGGRYWFISARMQSKTAYQKKTSTSDREERTFDMRVRVDARNVDMPSGTERVMTMLENAIQEKATPTFHTVSARVTKVDGLTITVDSRTLDKLENNRQFLFEGNVYKITNAPAAAAGAATRTLTLDKAPPARLAEQTIIVEAAKQAAAAVKTATVTLTLVQGAKATAAGNDVGLLVAGAFFTVGSEKYTISTVGTGTPKEFTFDRPLPQTLGQVTITLP